MLTRQAEWSIYAALNYANGDSDNSFSPARCQTIVWTNADVLLIRPSCINFSEIRIKIPSYLTRIMIVSYNRHFVISWTNIMNRGKWPAFPSEWQGWPRIAFSKTIDDNCVLRSSFRPYGGTNSCVLMNRSVYEISKYTACALNIAHITIRSVFSFHVISLIVPNKL